MKQGVLLAAHGAPERIEDIPAYLEQVLEAPAPASLIAEVSARYELIGGGSPLTAASRRQAEALARHLGLPVYLGMRCWHPFLHEAMAQATAEGIQRLAAICAAPQFSRAGLAFYGLGGLGDRRNVPQILWAPSVHRHRLFVEAVAERLLPLLPGREVLFTAHSLPGRVVANAPDYDPEARATAAAVAARCGLERWDFAYQSQGRAEGNWLGPTVEERLDALADRGVREAVLVPLSFVADNVEILHDVDVRFRRYALERGISLARTETLGDSSLFIEALAELAREQLEAAL
ncbi:MAG: ferrochelatase [Acidobacteria bacterium]|nr:ferrochelatase [Acidobacteriota bacterium]